MDGQTCNRLCQEFAEFTNTDTACGHFFLQDCEWNLEIALTRYFDQVRQNKPGSSTIVGSLPNVIAKGLQQSKLPQDPDYLNRLKLITWNLDGLDDKSRTTRTKVVCEIIKREKPTVVFFQELIKDTLQILTGNLDESYEIVAPSSKNAYFTAIFVLKSLRINRIDYKLMNFEETIMERDLLQVEIEINGKPFVLLTAHLESTKNFAATRTRQFQRCVNVAQNVPYSKTVIFGGDLNIRDSEIKSLPENLKDLWLESGSSPNARFTWDCMNNDNIQFSSGDEGEHANKFKPRCRFDRLYLRNAEPKSIYLDEFRFVGTERIRSCLCFPSDHYGICCEFKILS